jgi:hypothetical protein
MRQVRRPRVHDRAHPSLFDLIGFDDVLDILERHA